MNRLWLDEFIRLFWVLFMLISWLCVLEYMLCLCVDMFIIVLNVFCCVFSMYELL